MRGLGSNPGRQLTRHLLLPFQRRCHSGQPQWAEAQAQASPVDIEAIRAEMRDRPPQVHTDLMHPGNSDLLTTALSGFLPKECLAPQQQQQQQQRIPHAKEEDAEEDAHGAADHLPAGHHLVYFPLRRRHSELCPDGTDPYHSPRAAAFTRRMWAGGSIRGFRGLALDGRPAVCLERILDVNLRRGGGGGGGGDSEERIFVEVLREYMTRDEYARPESITGRGDSPTKGITERRTLVFMREPSDEEKKRMSLEQPRRRIIKAPGTPDYSVDLTPTPTLLFHYSALSYNAHRIHLDRAYCRDVEGRRDLLVHGPLSLTLMLSALRSRLRPEHGEPLVVDAVDYRHLAPLYVGERMRVSVRWRRQHPQRDVVVGRDKWELWIEDQDGGLCVRGTAETVAKN